MNLKLWIEIKLWDFKCWRTIKWLYLSCWLWKLRGLKSCEVHGFHAQSWITGKCIKCEVLNDD